MGVREQFITPRRSHFAGGDRLHRFTVPPGKDSLAENEVRLFMRHTALMSTGASFYHRHRFPTEIVSHCVWLYSRFSLSFRDVEQLMSGRGGRLSYGTVREWCFKFGQIYANQEYVTLPLSNADAQVK